MNPNTLVALLEGDAFTLSILNALSSLVHVVDPQFLFWGNKASRNLLEWRKGERCFEVLLGRDRPCEDCQIADVLANGEKFAERRLLDREGTEHSFSIKLSPITLRDGSRCVVQSLEDVTEEKKLLYRSTVDDLTGLFNRATFMEKIEAEFARNKRYKRGFGVIMLDIDHFKQVNDTYSHPAGDEVLRRVAAAISESLRMGDVPARYGGEEFIILLPETPLEESVVVAERIRRKTESLDIPHNGGGNILVTLSGGVSACKCNGDTIEEIIRAADRALYVSKDAGRNRITIES